MLSKQHAHGREHAIGHPALTDPETGLANQLHFDLVYSYLFAAGDRGFPFTLMMLSTGGPDGARGDEPKAVGERLQGATRESDLVAHLGGGRYVILLLGANLQGARIAADRLERVLTGAATGPISFGLAAFDAEMQDPSELLEAAAGALRTAEAAGGGVEFAPV